MQSLGLKTKCVSIKFGLKVFTDARQPVTLEEGDRYPLGPPSFVVVLARERHARNVTSKN